MPALVHRKCSPALPVVAAGIGRYAVDETWKTYLDTCGGAAVSCLGPCDATVRNAMCAQRDRLPFAHTGFFTSATAESYADLLLKNASDRLERVYPVSAGRNRPVLIFPARGSDLP